MDPTKTTTHVSLCAGYGGIDLGLSRAIPNLRTIAFSEIEAFACANLVSKMEAGLLDAAPIWTNLKTFPWSEFRDRVDVLSGGYPCQPFSAAGKRLGRDDPRHLWPWIADGIRAMRPRVCFFENVEGHISLGLREVISELEGLGYQTTWGVFSAREVGAPHQRKRVFILAYDKIGGLERLRKCSSAEGWSAQTRHSGGGSYLRTPKPTELANTVRNGSGEGWIPCKGSDGSESFSDGISRGASMADPSHSPDSTCRHAEADRLPSEHRSEVCSGQLRGADATAWPSRPGQPQHGWEPPRVVTGRQALDDSKERSMRDDSDNQRKTTGEGHPTDYSGLCSEPPRVVGNTSDWSNGQQPTEQQGWHPSGRSGEESGAMAYTDGPSAGSDRKHRRQLGLHPEGRTNRGDESNAERTENGISQAQPSLGGDSDGSSNWMDDAELFVTSDNRTDELRLLGNGVVPATATRAFLVLMDQLLNEKP